MVAGANADLPNLLINNTVNGRMLIGSTLRYSANNSRPWLLFFLLASQAGMGVIFRLFSCAAGGDF
jgi:hypothetical protein